MDADRGVEPAAGRDELQRALRRPQVPARDEDPLDARVACGAQHGVDVVVEAVRVDVAVGVDEAHARMLAGGQPTADDASTASLSTRGNSGAGVAVTRPGSVAAPHASSSRTSGPPLPSAPYVQAWPSCSRIRGAAAGMNGATAEPDEPARLDEVAQHVAQPRRGGLVARLRLLVERPRLLGVDGPVARRRTNSHSSPSASWSR